MLLSRRLALATLVVTSTGLPLQGHAAAVGDTAPGFELKDTQGKTVKLSDFKGRHVVLEWTNPGCPFVVKHYGTGNMQALQKEARARDVVWLSINSTARGHHDHMAPDALQQKLVKDWSAAPSAVLMDERGTVGKAYAARTTPHMYLIDPAGKLVYAGGIDDKRSSNPADIPAAKNFVRAALADSLAGRPVGTPSAPAYGCSIKYDAS